MSISVCISLGTVPTSPSLQKKECIGVVYCVPISVAVPTSPKIKVHKGCILSFVSFVQSIQNSITSDVVLFFSFFL